VAKRSVKLADQEAAGEEIVTWPQKVVGASTTDSDLAVPLVQLLVDLGIKGTDQDEISAAKAGAALSGSPSSVAIIEAGATAASKGWTSAIAALGGGTAVWAALSNFWKAQQTAQSSIVIAASVVIAACVLSAGLIMYGDVRARGQGAAAQYQARAAIACAFLAGATGLATKPPRIRGENLEYSGRSAIPGNTQEAVITIREELRGLQDIPQQSSDAPR
jgi:hypothetical protein